MRFSKSIFCDDVKIEITADTHTMIDKGYAYDLDNFLTLYENVSSVAKLARIIHTKVTEIPLQVEFWRNFCSVLVKSERAGFLGFAGSRCLSGIWKGDEVPDSVDVWVEGYRNANDCWVDSHYGTGKYRGCKDIKLEDNNHIVVTVWYSRENTSAEYQYSLNYPFDYLELLENMEAYIVKKTAPQKGLYEILFQKEPKVPTPLEGDQMIIDFLKTNEKQIQQFKIYAQHVKDVELCKEKAKELYEKFCSEGALIIDNRGFLQKYCQFNILKKKEEVDAIIKKLQNSIDAGEEEVEYAMRWLCAESAFHFKAIRKNCETKYRYGCILLKNQSFIDEQQEYDHILVSDRGIILIETKNWKGKVEIRSDGKWVRDSENNGSLVGVESPLYQIQRHEALIKSILPNVPIYSLLVFSNPSLILEGGENCNMCRVIYVDQLKETVINILSLSEPTDRMIDYCVNEIEKYKVNIMGDDVKELK